MDEHWFEYSSIKINGIIKKNHKMCLNQYNNLQKAEQKIITITVSYFQNKHSKAKESGIQFLTTF